MIIVADASPLIAFALLGKLDILNIIFDEIFIPEAVYREITHGDKPFGEELEKFTRKRIQKVANRLAVNVLCDELDEGESEAIIYALENNIGTILIDEHKGRRIASAKGLQTIGTIGTLLQAKKKGVIGALKPNLDYLIDHEFRISDLLYQRALKIAGEKR